MPTYSVYGFTLVSDWRLPCPGGADSGPAIVRLKKGPAALFRQARSTGIYTPNQPRLYAYARLKEGGTFLSWPGLFEFIISPDGRVILGHPHSDAPAEAFNTYLLGQVLSFSLLRQGTEHYHATAVVVDGGAVCFLGNCGYGKSTLAAGFLGAGYRLLTDDILVFKQDEQDLYAYPGPPRIKLFPAITRSTLGDKYSGTPMDKFTTKQIIALSASQVYSKAAPVRAIYILNLPADGERTAKPVIRRLSARRALLKLIQGTFNARVMEPERLRNQFLTSQEISSRVAVKGLWYPRTLRGLRAAREAILMDLSR